MNKVAQERYNSFDEFWPGFFAAAEIAKAKKRTGPVLTLLNRQVGFVPNEAQANLHQTIRDLPNSETLQFTIFLHAKTRRSPSRVISAVADQIWPGYKKVADFPDRDAPTWIDVRDWIADRFLKVAAEKQDVLSAGRALFACLLQVRERDFYLNSLLFLADSIGGTARKKGSSEQNEIEVVVGELLTRPKLNRKPLALVGRSGRAMRDVVDMALDQRRQAVARVDLQLQEIGNLQIGLKQKMAEVEEQRTALAVLKTQLTAAQEELSAAQGRVAGTEEHWEVVSKQQLAGVVSKLRGEIDHEIKEILFSLERTTPNTEMAIQRVRRVEKILQKADNAQ